MLLSLHIQNFTLIDELELEFGAGLNVLTGETGAGKSRQGDPSLNAPQGGATGYPGILSGQKSTETVDLQTLSLN